jgi:dipeptidyl-peptidase-4
MRGPWRILLLIVATLGIRPAPADVTPRVTRQDYARAERFLSWNKDRYVLNADIQHHWIGQEDRFWYMRTTATHEKEFVVVDAVAGKQTIAFDHARLAAMLSNATASPVRPGNLPFSTFSLRDGGAEIELRLGDQLWRCRFERSTCDEAPLPVAESEVISPDGKWAAFLRDHNVWVRSLTGHGPTFALTTDGAEHYGYGETPGYSTHSISDLRARKPMQPQVLWSPDSRLLLTHRLDERKVADLHLVQAVPEDGSTRPKLYTYRYPMAGDEQLPMSQLVILDVHARRHIAVATAPMICSTATLIEKQEAWWSSRGDELFFLRRDRFSKSVGLYRASASTGHAAEVLRETSDTIVQTNGNNVFDRPQVRTLSNGDVIWYSQRDGWGHLYYYDSTGRLKNRITSGNWVVRSIARVDEVSRTIYFSASGREAGRDPYEQRLYSIGFDGSALVLLTPEPADHSWPFFSFGPAHDDPLAPEAQKAQFSMSGRYFIDHYSRPDLPPVMMLKAADGRTVLKVEEADISELRAGGYTPIEPFMVMAADGRTPIFGNIFRPSKFDPQLRYPIIDASYPGPQAIRTAKRFTAAAFDVLEAQSLAELGFIVITLDGRGTPHRSKAFLDHSYGRLDRASDLEDHIAGIRQLARRYPYMDISRVGIDGASGGGAAAVRAILSYPNFYKVAVAAEGNQDQRSYLASWGDTYMGPAKRGDYQAASTLPLAKDLTGKLLLMHGELDDNVPPSSTLQLVDALVKANKDFDLLILPNANHMAFATSTYFIRRKWDYFVRHLLQAEPPANYSIARPQ